MSTGFEQTPNTETSSGETDRVFRFSSADDCPEYEHLTELESRSIFIIREAFEKCDNPGLLWSMGKDSTVLLWLIRKAFLGRVPFPVLHVDTGYKIPSMIAFRDHIAKLWDMELIVGENRKKLAAGQTYPDGNATRVECCSSLKKDALRALVTKHNFEALFVGIRRDEDGTRAKERYFSPRNEDFEWDYEGQPLEVWDQFNADFTRGGHLRIHPLLHWTEINIWEYIDREQIPTMSLYFAGDGRTRYRSLGCAPCTFPIQSTATTVPEIIAELKISRVAERSTRAQDQECEAAFEELRKSGYM